MRSFIWPVKIQSWIHGSKSVVRRWMVRFFYICHKQSRRGFTLPKSNPILWWHKEEPGYLEEVFWGRSVKTDTFCLENLKKESIGGIQPGHTKRSKVERVHRTLFRGDPVTYSTQHCWPTSWRGSQRGETKFTGRDRKQSISRKRRNVISRLSFWMSASVKL